MPHIRLTSDFPIMLPAMDGLILRKATPSDVNFAFHVKKTAFQGYVERIGIWDEEAQRILHERRFDSQDFRVISLAGVDAGIIALDILDGCVKVNQIFVLPDYQGRGIGRACMSFIMDEAGKMHLPVRLRVLKVNPRALAFYERLGFERVDETDLHYLMEWKAGELRVTNY